MVFLVILLAASSSSGGLASHVPGNCLTGRCVLRKEDNYLYQALDGAHPMQSPSTGCQNYFMDIPTDWDVSSAEAAVRAELQDFVQKYPWGTGTMSAARRRYYGLGTAMGQRRRMAGGVFVSASRVKVYSCNARILIRQRYQSIACAHNATVGPTKGCLPSLAFVSAQMKSPELLVKSAGASTVTLQLKLTTLPVSVYLSHSLSYVFGIAPDEASLNSTYTACKELWSSDILGNETTFSRNMSYSDYIDINETCKLSQTITEEYIFLQGVLGVFVWGSANGTDTVIKTWTQRVNISYSTDTTGGLGEDLIAFGTEVITLPPISTQAPPFAATLQIYKSEAFIAVKALPAYVVGKRLYAVMTLLGGGDLGIVLKRVWLSLSQESTGAVLHELAFQDHGNAGERNKIRFSVDPPACADCYFYATARIVRRRLQEEEDEEEVGGQDDPRELQDIGESITSNSVLITVLPSSPVASGSEGSSHADPEWQSWGIVLVVLVFAAAIVLASFSQVVRKLLAKCRRRSRSSRYQGVAQGTDQELEEEEEEHEQEEHHSNAGPGKALPLGLWPITATSTEAEESI